MKPHVKLRFLVSTLAALMLSLAALPALAAPGDIDTTFNGGVPAVIDLGAGNYLDPSSAAVNPLNGDILWVGQNNGSGVIAAYMPDGTLNPAFGGTGEITLDPSVVGFPGGNLELDAIAVDGQGRILTAGDAGNSGNTAEGMLLMRLNPDGSLDTSFGAAGTGFVLSPAYFADGTGLSLTADGHILVTGDVNDSSGSPNQFAVWRFNADGTPDSSFGTGGELELASIADSNYLLCRPALQPDGALLVGCSQAAAQSWTIARLMSDGSLDTSFGNSGMVTSSAGQYALGDLALAPDGGFVVAQGDGNSGTPVSELRRYLADGSVDPNFNGGNPLTIGSIPYFDGEIRIAVQPDGKMLVTLYDNTSVLHVIRYLADGTLDNGFGSSSTASVDFSNIGGSSYVPVPRALVLQGDSKIVTVGWAEPSPRAKDISFVTRLDNDAFNFTPAAFSFTNQTGVDRGVTITSNTINVSGLSNGVSVPVSVTGGEYEINSGTWTSNPGITINGDQIAIHHTSSGSYSTQTTTTLTVGGYAVPNNGSLVLGTPASATFTSTTKAAPPPPPPPSSGGGDFGPLALLGLLLLTLVPWWLRHRRTRSTATQSREDIPMKSHLKLRFLVSTLATLALSLAALPAFAAPGDIDTTFNSGRPAVIDLNPASTVQPFAAAINPLNGDILWAGFLQTPTGEGGAIAAYKPDGMLDPAVGGGSGEIGLTPTQAGFTGGSLVFFAIAVDSQGRILVAGEVDDAGGTTSAMVLARFKPDGSLDTGFGSTGIVTDALNSHAFGTGLSLTADGHILVTGDAEDAGGTEAQLTVWRFNPDGTTDTAFGSTGHVQIAAVNSPFTVFCFPALQPDGALIAGCIQTTAGSWKLTRLKADGTVDTGFGTSGYLTGAAGLTLNGLALAPDGGFVISELNTSTSPPYPLDMRRFLAAGSVDTGFNSGNPLLLGTVPVTMLVPIAVQPDGKILLSGDNGANGLLIGRFLADGTADASFGTNGQSLIDFTNIGGYNYKPTTTTALLLQADGRIVASGWADSTAGSGEAAFVTRVLSDVYDLTPTAPAFNNVARAPLGQALASNAITVSGVSIGSATSGFSLALVTQNGKYSTSGTPFTGTFTGTNDAWAPAGNSLALEQMTPSSGGTATTTTVVLGGFWAANNYEIPLGSPATANWTTTTDQPPVASDGTLSATTAKATTGTLSVTNPSSGTLAFAIVTAPTHGTATITNTATGAYSYTSAAGYTGSDSFTWKVNDGVADSNIATESVTVEAAPSSGGGGGFGPLALLGLLFLALVPWWLRRRSLRPTSLNSQRTLR